MILVHLVLGRVCEDQLDSFPLVLHHNSVYRLICMNITSPENEMMITKRKYVNA